MPMLRLISGLLLACCLPVVPVAAQVGLVCDLLETKPGAEEPTVRTPRPLLGWIYNDSRPNAQQTAYQIRWATSEAKLQQGEQDVWDSGKVLSGQSTNLPYQGPDLLPSTLYYWQVRTWGTQDYDSGFSRPQAIRTSSRLDEQAVSHHRLTKSILAPQTIQQLESGDHLVDFGRAAFGTVRLTVTSEAEKHQLQLGLGEVLGPDGQVNRSPGGTRRYREISLPLQPGTHTYTLAIPPDHRNTHGAAILLPEHVGEVLPFRYCQIRGYAQPISAEQIQQVTVHYPFDDDAAHFECSDQVLNQVWQLCKYSIKATSFAGLYVDGDRERIPYEADAYINQLCHYAVDREYAMARRTHEYLVTHPTWPTEWIMHSVLMAEADYQYTGDIRSFEKLYKDLQAKTLQALAGEEGFISTRTGKMDRAFRQSIHYRGQLRDIVDWPAGERDGYDFRDINTVVNAFHYRSLLILADMADRLHKPAEASAYRQQAKQVADAMVNRLFDTQTGRFVDGVGSQHSALHASMFPVALGLTPEGQESRLAAFLSHRSMACSVYGAQYLLDALYELGEAESALNLMRSTDERSWWNMIRDGSTITMEAWANRFKPNQDWNHAWGAAPANVIVRRLMGVRPLKPGFESVLIEPQPGSLTWARVTAPTLRGPVRVDYRKVDASRYTLRVTIPGNTQGVIRLRKAMIPQSQLRLDGQLVTIPAGTDTYDLAINAGEHMLEVAAP